MCSFQDKEMRESELESNGSSSAAVEADPQREQPEFNWTWVFFLLFFFLFLPTDHLHIADVLMATKMPLPGHWKLFLFIVSLQATNECYF